MIRVYTKERHKMKISQFLDSLSVKYEIYTIKDDPPITKFDLGVSYCYPRKITEPLLSMPKKGFVNYHPAPLPKYKGPHEHDEAIKNKETHWGVTVHYMDENYDTGPIIKVKQFDLHEPPTSSQELGAVSHYFLFQLFKETISDIYNGKVTSQKQSIE
jgi:methionyl-tRNA formyltransferase